MLWFLIISTPFVPNLIVNSLEVQYNPVFLKQLKNAEFEYHIVILGGGHGFDDRLPANSLLSQNALGRLNEGIRLQQQLPNSKLILSGYSSSGRTTQAEMLKKSALILGINDNVILLQKEPANTYEEAKVYTQKFGHIHPVILVTSAVHMPRAMLAFRHFGIEPIPSPTNYRLKGSRRWKWMGLPSLRNMENMKKGLYEYVGIFWYNLKIK